VSYHRVRSLAHDLRLNDRRRTTSPRDGFEIFARHNPQR